MLKRVGIVALRQERRLEHPRKKVRLQPDFFRTRVNLRAYSIATGPSTTAAAVAAARGFASFPAPA